MKGEKKRELKWTNRGRGGRRRSDCEAVPLLLLMIWLEDPGEPLSLIDVKCVISLLIKAEASNAQSERREQTGSLTCLMGMARPLPMLSARASRPFLSLSASFAFLDCGEDRIRGVVSAHRSKSPNMSQFNKSQHLLQTGLIWKMIIQWIRSLKILKQIKELNLV